MCEVGDNHIQNFHLGGISLDIRQYIRKFSFTVTRQQSCKQFIRMSDLPK